MANNNIIDIISKEASLLGFIDWSYAKASHLSNYEEFFKTSLDNDLFAQMEYLKRNIHKRFNPQELVEDSKSIIIFLAPYGNNQRINNPINITINNQIESKYKVSQYALGEDYHKIIKDKLNIILNRLKEEHPLTTGRVFTDTAPIYERGWGAKSGLGFIGKNNFLISPKYGIRNFIGIIICNLEFETYPQINNKTNYCGNCTKCIDACPTKALKAPFTLDANKCLSYLTIEKKGSNIYDNIDNASNNFNTIFGCDICMNVCPWNSKNSIGWAEFEPKELPINVEHFKRR